MKKYTLPVLDISLIPKVSLTSMNDTHKEEVVLVNQLGVLLDEALQGSADPAAITDKLNEWLDHTREHFSRENQLMLDYQFPAYPVHSGEHQRVLEQLESVRQQWLDHQSVEQLAQYLFVDWLDWFHQHVNSMDAVTASFLNRVTGK